MELLINGSLVSIGIVAKTQARQPPSSTVQLCVETEGKNCFKERLLFCGMYAHYMFASGKHKLEVICTKQINKTYLIKSNR